MRTFFRHAAEIRFPAGTDGFPLKTGPRVQALPPKDNQARMDEANQVGQGKGKIPGPFSVSPESLSGPHKGQLSPRSA